MATELLAAKLLCELGGYTGFELLVAAKKRADRVYVSGQRYDIFAAFRHLLAHFWAVWQILQILLEFAVEIKEACAQGHELALLKGVQQMGAHDMEGTW